jgi:hypothetical protein
MGNPKRPKCKTYRLNLQAIRKHTTKNLYFLNAFYVIFNLGFGGKGLPFLFTAAVTIAISTEILTKSYKMFLPYLKLISRKASHYISGHITGHSTHEPGSNIVPNAHHGITSIFLARSLICCDRLLNS